MKNKIQDSNPPKLKILFVCLGNICRSSCAESVMRYKLEAYGLNTKVEVDSAGLIDYHEGELSDSRMIYHAKQRGYSLTHRSRPICREDFLGFDLIIGMDDSNINRLRGLCRNANEMNKIHKMTEYSIKYSVDSVPDPYYGTSQSFENVLDLLEDACEGLIQSLAV